MAETALADAPQEMQSALYVDVPLEQRGRAMPPLYDGYRALFAHITTITLDAQRTRRVTDRIRNCAARILCFLNYQLARVPHPEDGIRSSRSHFQDLFRGDYGLDIIEIAQAVLIASGLVFEPEQENSTDRAFCWRINALRLQQALAEQTSFSTPQLKANQHSKPMSRVSLVPRRDGASTGRADSSGEVLSLSHKQKSRHGDRDITPSMPGFQDDHAQISGDGCGDISACKKKKQREYQEKRDHSSIPPQEKQVDGRGENRASSESNEQPPQELRASQDVEEIIEVFQDAPNTPETLIAFFDRLRGYQLTGKLLQTAHMHAQELCFGKEDMHRPGYPLQIILLTTIYLLKHDPTWQEHYEIYCGRTGIPDIWAVNKWIGAKWPLARRRLLETGAYILLDDGTLLSCTAYQAMLVREQEEWERENQTDMTELVPLQAMKEEVRRNERLVERTEEVEQEAQLAAPSRADEVEADAEPKGFPTSYVASLHASRLRRVLPPYFQVDVQLVRDAVFELVITNLCDEDDVTVLTCNQQVCEVLRVVQEERKTEQQMRGWSLLTIVEWWCDFLQHKLSSEYVVEVQALEAPRFGVVLRPRLSQAGERFLVANNWQAEEILAQRVETPFVARRRSVHRSKVQHS